MVLFPEPGAPRTAIVMPSPLRLFTSAPLQNRSDPEGKVANRHSMQAPQLPPSVFGSRKDWDQNEALAVWEYQVVSPR